MRGKDQELTFTGLKTRITPAYAGKSGALITFIG